MTRKGGVLRRIIRGLVVLVMALTVVSLLVIWRVGAWNLVFPSHSHDTVAPVIPSGLAAPAVLVFSKTNSFRHVEGIAGGAKALAAIARNRKWGTFHTENGAVFNATDLARFSVVVFLNASGDMLNSEQELALQNWVEAGGGWLGIHAAGDRSHEGWQWYRDNFIGADFTAHIMGPQFQRATVVLENHLHPVLRGLPDIWQHEEEWYSWEQSPRAENFTILAVLDEDSYTPVQRFMGNQRDLSMGDHPVLWSNCIGNGRSVYAAMGHRAEAFAQPQVNQGLDNALQWLMGRSRDACIRATLSE